MNRLSRFATTVAASGSLALAGLGLSAGTAQADPNTATVMSWCPGQAPPDRGIRWDMNVFGDHLLIDRMILGGTEMPAMKGFTADTEWVLLTLQRPGDVAVGRD
ncbi:MAG: hypothetical protein QOE52_1245 [Mycobacterium sp.]|jgi:hypothetical protein|nr:hypothetical protein [Mycobacterium sp.]MDT5252916.1 hypothetical protein [Mycobacterium sp.]MDT5342061.1 hypothetical protein [Mycobacterium sp.]